MTAAAWQALRVRSIKLTARLRSIDRVHLSHITDQLTRTQASSHHVRPVIRKSVAGPRTCLASTHISSFGRAEDASKNPPHESSWKTLFIPSSQLEEAVSEQQKDNGSPGDGPEDGPNKPPKPVDYSYYGSALRRARRNVKEVKELPPVPIPEWLLERNVVLAGANLSGVGHQSLTYNALEEHTASSGAEQKVSSEVTNQNLDGPRLQYEESPATYLRKQLKIHTSTVGEISSLVQAGLRLPNKDNIDTVASIKPHINLSCPRKGGSAYLSTFVEDLAQQNNADFLRLSAQDIAEVGGDYMEEASDFQTGSLSSLGYDMAQVSSSQGQPAAEDYAEQDDWDAADDDESQSRTHSTSVTKTLAMPIRVGFMSGAKLDDFFKQNNKISEWFSNPSQTAKPPAGHQAVSVKDDTADMKMTLLVETLLNSPELQRQRNKPNDSQSVPSEQHVVNESADHVEVERGTNSLIVLIEDYPLINMTSQGYKILEKIYNVVETRRKEGQPVLIVGTSSSEKILGQGDAKKEIDEAQAFSWDRWARNVIVPIKSKDEGLLWLEHKRKLREFNLRHVRDMLRRTAPNREQVQTIVEDRNLTLESKYAFIASLDRSVWPMHKVSRIATIALGLPNNSEPMSATKIGEALAIIDASDNSKYKWHKRDVDKVRNKETTHINSTDAQEQAEDRLKKLRKKCNSHEKKLLNGVVDAKSIRTTFADVQAPAETVEALKTLTSLSLVRPDAFTYGVLATDRIPGILLYGPPGTGKTLLAKAVAKESGATVLEVSGSDVYDMYVGEGEKNVKAIFSLARKLSPCVVFIDEADAILGSRNSGHSRTSHRELINQFLREWDGMTDTSAFIMIATNRPYDLDEASLRRVPRRLLVDLPVEKDRKAILDIHLKEERLDPDVSIEKLAGETPFYSGSDLKNLCVAAALACVREEYETASAHNRNSPGDEYIYAEKRTLYPRHFTKAMEEISASISEDMGSLSAIRKFDEKYGDRRGRRKKLGGYGFKTVDDSEKLGSDAARVRNQT